MQIKSLLALSLSYAGAFAASAAFVDPKSNISFSQWSSSSGLTFGIAMPQSPGADFIGRIAAPMRAKWGGVTLGPSMTGKLIPTAWPNGGSVVSSLRLARSKSNPPEYSGAAKLVTIKEGTYVNGTHWTYTFLCQGCITGSSLSFGANSASARLGWGMSSMSVGNPGTSSAKLGMHNAGTGTFNIDLAGAKHEKYGAWAAMAKG